MTENIKFSNGESVPLEMHKIKIIHKLNLLDVDERKKCVDEAFNNTFLLHNKDIFLDMLTDSGVNAMSDNQQSALLRGDDSYAGTESFFRLEKTCQKLFGKKFLVPAHQGRACENILAKTLVKNGDVVPMNFHFTTTKAHITIMGGSVEELIIDEGLKPTSNFPFKGNIDINKLRDCIKRNGRDKIPFVRMEAGTNLIGGQPFSLENVKEIRKVCNENNIKLLADFSLLTDNLFFIKTKEKSCRNMSIEEITMELSKQFDIIYFSARKLGSSRGGCILMDDENLKAKMSEFCTVFEGFTTYGGMSVHDMEATNIGLQESMDFTMINQGPEFIHFLGEELQKNNVPIVTPTGGLGLHLNAREFVKHIPQNQYMAGSLAIALFLVSGIRGMERGTLSEQRNKDGSERFAEMELLRLAVPRRVFTLSHMKFVADRVSWLWKNRNLIGGLKFIEEPSILRFFFGKLAPVDDWQDKLIAKFKEDFGKL